MRKRIVSLFLALALCMGLTVPASAYITLPNEYLTHYWDNDAASWAEGWEDELSYDYLNDSPEQLDYWSEYMSVDTFRSTGYCVTDWVYGSGKTSKYFGVVVYCDAPARVTLLQDNVWEANFGGFCAIPVGKNGVIRDGWTADWTGYDDVEPTYMVDHYPDDENLSGKYLDAGTYWDLPEGLYWLSSYVGPEFYFVVGSPENVTIPAANRAAGSASSVSSAKSTRATGSTPSFSDVKPGFWCYDAVNWAVENNITTGFTATTFGPDQTCSHAQILTFLWRASGSPKAEDDNPYKNPAITPDKYYYDALLWAWGQGLIVYDTFDPNTPCKRSDVVTYLWKQCGSPAVSSSTFTDVPANDINAGAVAWAVDAGITTGTTATTFSPNRTCTRGHIVTFLYRFFMEWKGMDWVSVTTQTELNALPDRVDADQIKKVTAVNAGINDLSALREMPGLTYLNLFFNLDIGSLEPLRNLTELTYLDLSANGVKDISALSGLKKLTYLDLGGNGTINDLTPLYGLKNLTGLNLDFDHVTEEQANALQAQLPGCRIEW